MEKIQVGWICESYCNKARMHFEETGDMMPIPFYIDVKNRDAMGRCHWCWYDTGKPVTYQSLKDKGII